MTVPFYIFFAPPIHLTFIHLKDSKHLNWHQACSFLCVLRAFVDCTGVLGSLGGCMAVCGKLSSCCRLHCSQLVVVFVASVQCPVLSRARGVWPLLLRKQMDVCIGTRHR